MYVLGVDLSDSDPRCNYLASVSCVGVCSRDNRVDCTGHAQNTCRLDQLTSDIS
jgi:hypothetical protein